MHLLKKLFGFGKKKNVVNGEREVAVCPECFEVAVGCHCLTEKKLESIGVDKGLYDLIQKLNESGYKTVYSCEGHTKLTENPNGFDYYGVTGAYIEFENSTKIFELLSLVNRKLAERKMERINFQASTVSKRQTIYFGYSFKHFEFKKSYKKDKAFKRAEDRKFKQLSALRKAFCDALCEIEGICD